MSEAVFEERFVKLVEDNGGFEYYQAYRGEETREGYQKVTDTVTVVWEIE